MRIPIGNLANFATIAAFAAVALSGLKDINMFWLVSSIIPLAVLAMISFPRIPNGSLSNFFLVHYAIVFVCFSVWIGVILGGELLRSSVPAFWSERVVDLAIKRKAPFGHRDPKDWESNIRTVPQNSAWLSVKTSGSVTAVNLEHGLRSLINDSTKFSGWIAMGFIILFAIMGVMNRVACYINERINERQVT